VAKVSLEDTEAVFGALAHEARRNILLLLAHLGGELPSGYLAARFQHSWPTTTRHLSVLQKAGLVTVRREGRGSFYRLNRERVRQVLGTWLGYLDPVDPEQKWAPSGPRSTRTLRNPPGTPPSPVRAKPKGEPR
jgi:DNA-binding transcriptional ArsR family regulator